MKIRHIEIEGTPDELRGFNLEEFLGKLDQPQPDVQPEKEWLNGSQFEFAMSQKGYKHLRTLSTKKKLCDRYGLQYRKSGRDVVFHNLLEKIPDKC